MPSSFYNISRAHYSSSSINDLHDKDHRSAVCLWMLRCLFQLHACDSLREGNSDDGETIPLPRGILYLMVDIRIKRSRHRPMSRAALLRLLRARWRTMEADNLATKGASCAITGHIGSNIKYLSDYLQLSEHERKLLSFFTLLNFSYPLEDCTDLLGKLDIYSLKRALGHILDIPAAEIDKALHPKAALNSSGLVKIDRSSNFSMKSKVDVVEGLIDAFLEQQSDVLNMLRHFFYQSDQAEFGLEDFSFIDQDVELLVKYLQKVRRSQQGGVNILIYGDPGTGKTQLVHTIARSLKLKLFTISMENVSGSPLNGEDRFAAYCLSQNILHRHGNALILFDEIEDVIVAHRNPFVETSSRGRQKAWINNLLENNPVPAFWVCNETQSFDPSFIRRFDYVLEVPRPKNEARQRLIDRYLKHLPQVSREFRERLYHTNYLLPAQIEKATRIAASIDDNDPDDTEQLIEQILDNNLRALGYSNKSEYRQHATAFNLKHTNTSVDLATLSQKLNPNAQARLVLYGPPGTGKTAYAEYLSQKLGKQLLIRQASDLLGSYVGETEGNIADMFFEAESARAMLLLDEADSFLQNRNNAQRSWEITMVNELLVQIEQFSGIFIAATNLFANIDDASLRRFDIKVKFDYLRPEQVVRMARSVLRVQGKTLSKSAEPAYKQLRYLTPGDFSAVVRRGRILQEQLTGRSLLAALSEESKIKQERHSKPMGFIIENRQKPEK